MRLTIRRIQPGDNTAVETIVRSILPDFGCVGEGYASGDAELLDMYTAYQQPGSAYWVIEDEENHTVLGVGGFARLEGSLPDEAICELRKLYFLPVLRGQGYGRKFLSLLMQEAARAGYQEMYLESVPRMVDAIRLYEKMGFQRLDTNKGNTGHQNRCEVYMTRSLENVPLDHEQPVSITASVS